MGIFPGNQLPISSCSTIVSSCSLSTREYRKRNPSELIIDHALAYKSLPPGAQHRMRSNKHSTKDRVYCAEQSCSKFIPPFNIENEHGMCPQCRRETHLPCRSLAHPGVDCPMYDKLQSILAIAEEENWRRCSNCRTMIELHHGCNHMTCR